VDQGTWQKQAQDNHRAIDTELKELGQLFEENEFKDFWQKVRTIRELFKTLKPIARDERENLWTRFSDLCEQAKKQRAEKQEASDSAKRDILSRIFFSTSTGSPTPINLFGHDELEESEHINETIQKAQANLSSIFEDLRQLRDQLTREDSQECWGAYNEARTRLRELRESLNDRDYYHLTDEVSRVWNDATYGENPYEVLDEIKELQRRVRNAVLNKDQRQEIRDNLGKAWDEAISRIEKVKAERRERYEAWRQKQEDWIDRKKAQIENGEKFIERLESQVSDLEDKISESRHEDWISQAEGWIEEKQDKIREVKQQVDDLREAIDEAESKLSDS